LTTFAGGLRTPASRATLLRVRVTDRCEAESVAGRPATQEVGKARERSADDATLAIGTRHPRWIRHLIGLFDQPLHTVEIPAFDKHQDAPRARRAINGDASRDVANR